MYCFCLRLLRCCLPVHFFFFLSNMSNKHHPRSLRCCGSAGRGTAAAPVVPGECQLQLQLLEPGGGAPSSAVPARHSGGNCVHRPPRALSAVVDYCVSTWTYKRSNVSIQSGIDIWDVGDSCPFVPTTWRRSGRKHHQQRDGVAEVRGVAAPRFTAVC